MAVINTIGRRKKSIARIYMEEGSGNITVNSTDLKTYFPSEILQTIVNQPLTVLEANGNYDIKVNVRGGGTTGQAEAIRFAISRALCEMNPENRVSLKPEGMLTRDSRVVERKKPGQKKARKKFQWVKR